MIHDATAVVSTGRKDRKINMEINKPYSVVQCNKFMKSIDRADQYLSFHSLLRKTVKWSKKLVLYLLNCALFNAFFVYRTLNINKKSKVQELPPRGRKVLEIEVSPILMTFSYQRSKQHQEGLKSTHQADSMVISEHTNLKKLLVVGRENGSILQDV